MTPRPAAGRKGGGWALLVAGLLAGLGWVSPVTARPGEDARRPVDAPLLGTSPTIPPVPAEYLIHEQAGLRFAYHPSARDRVRALIDASTQLRQALRRELGRPVLAAVEIRVAVQQTDFARIAPRSGPTASGPGRAGPPDGVAVLSLAELSLLVMNLDTTTGSDHTEPEAAFRHGLAHLALDEALGGASVPRWLHEGYAVHVAGELRLGPAAELSMAALRGRLVPWDDLDGQLAESLGPDPVGREQAADAVSFLTSVDDGEPFRRLVAQSRRGIPFGEALTGAYGAGRRHLERRWRSSLAWRAVFMPLLAGGLAVALLGTVVARRMRRRALRRAAARQVARPPSPRKPLVRQQTASTVDRGDEQLLADAVALGEQADPEVPKVSHEGQWHTLH